MNYKPQINAVLLSSLLLLTGCAGLNPPSVQSTQIPPPPAELMAPEDSSASYLDSVLILLQSWRTRLIGWKEKS